MPWVAPSILATQVTTTSGDIIPATRTGEGQREKLGRAESGSGYNSGDVCTLTIYSDSGLLIGQICFLHVMIKSPGNRRLTNTCIVSHICRLNCIIREDVI